MFDKILIANRGEIACRVIKTARKMGIKTVAVYSDADRDARHVTLADEAVHIGAAPSRESYLQADRIIAACKQTGAQAVHPGYGFLSENEAFARRVEEEGIAFIGPKHYSIAAMGDKIASKRLANDARVNTIPGWNEAIESAERAVAIAKDVGYPVMIKASAGGGGKGLRVAFNDKEAFEGFTSCRNEARNSFGDDRVFIEKFVEEPRHIEIQVLGDNHGNVIYLNERECSIQRRHQKVIEEAPSPFLDAATRKAMGEQAVALAKAVQYQSAGTVEFVVDRDRNFYFLEMNTRLQVEHPVTELVTGLDLVEQMIRIAAGEKLAFGQQDVKLEGWAMEARVYAEDPFRNFLPSIGRLVRCQPPVENSHVRVDTGIEEGSEVSMFYDPMIAKLITYGDNRDQAIDRMADALDAYYIRGVSHNISFLNALVLHPRFRAGHLSTNFIAEEYPDGFRAEQVPKDDPALTIAVAAVAHRVIVERSAKLSGQLPSHERRLGADYVVIEAKQHHAVQVVSVAHGWEVNYAGHSYRVVTDWRPGQPLLRADVNGHQVTFQIDRVGPKIRLFHRGAQTDVLVLPPKAAALTRYMLDKAPPDLSKFLLSPMPGLLSRLMVKEGQEVKAGEEICVVEAMKMENSLRAPNDVVIGKLLAQQGQSLTVDQPIVEFG